MKYQCGTEVRLGDKVTVCMPRGAEPARVIMLGETYEHLEIDEDFLKWIDNDRVLEKTDIVIERFDELPYASTDGGQMLPPNYMFTCLGTVVSFVARRANDAEEAPMTTKHRKKLVHEGKYAAEVDVELINDESGWGPYLSLADAQKLDHVREALRRGDIKSASQLARVFSLTPIAV